MTTWTDAYYDTIKACRRQKHLLKQWDISFLDSIENYLNQEKPLTHKQIQALDKIWQRVTKFG